LLAAAACGSSGGAPQGNPDAGWIDAPPLVGDGGPASYLGLLCGGHCPDGYACVRISSSATMGWCADPCTGQADDTSCSAGFAGPGQGQCRFLIPSAGDAGLQSVCGIGCGAQWGLSDDCPTGLHCADLISSTGAATPDGMNDTCEP
jgi:hypothetical protein